MSITKELTIDELNEKFPNVDIGFAVVCKTINKVYEMVNGYKEWVSYDITSINLWYGFFSRIRHGSVLCHVYSE